ncbi:hypothetical protein M9458_055434 [Cirrhinus mrigala]|uniref:HAT C-terminal dimerisation domain-containing protein n=1 Tax=Cirrhinus mrigala TaxID=683832 RepID=A0ABD0MHT3_CIRMR
MMCLKEHLSNVIEKSKKLHVSPGSRGRGSLISLLSKTTVNSVIDTIWNLIQQSISTEIRKAGMFSVQPDTTQDITAQDQCSVILRYVTDVVNERLVAVVRCSASTGQSFVDLLKECYSHVLNLVLSDTTQIVIESGSLFDLLSDTAVFIRESYQRVNIWEKESHDKRHRRIAPIGETRWWAKHDALNKIFGSFGKPQDSLYIDVLSTLTAIQELKTVKGNVHTEARGYKEGLLRYETILTAQLFLRIFEHTSPLSKYLQTEGMDILSAHRMVMSTQDALKKMARDFQAVKAAADDFVKWANEKLEQQDEETDMEVEAALPQKRRKKKKAMPGEMSQDDTIIDAERAYEVKVHNQIADTAIEAIHQRFLTHGTLYADLSFLDPKNFSLIRNHALPKSALEDPSKCLVKFDDRATVDNLQYELKSLAGQWDKLKESPLDEYVTRTVEDGPDGKEEDMEIINKSCASCKDCPLCCYQILQRFNMLTDAYPLLGLAYKFLLTLSITQVACEQSFSTLKYIKSRLRSSLSASKLEAFMLMVTEKDILVALDTDTVIDRVAEKATEETAAIVR